MATEISPVPKSEIEPTGQEFHYSPWRFFWAMYAVAWSSFAHPFSYTWIDLETGKMRHFGGQDEKDGA